MSSFSIPSYERTLHLLNQPLLMNIQIVFTNGYSKDAFTFSLLQTIMIFSVEVIDNSQSHYLGCVEHNIHEAKIQHENSAL
jgi:hypothetical protein